MASSAANKNVKRPNAAAKSAALKPTLADPWSPTRAAGLLVLRAPNLSKLTWLVHGFSTRPGGESKLPLREQQRSSAAVKTVLNLGFTDWDVRERVQRNRAKFFRAIGADTLRPVMLRQIHSDAAVAIFGNEPTAAETPNGDALLTREPGVLVVVQTADCVPILLADPRQRAVAAVHAGWRGTVQRIAQKTIGRMQMEFGTRPEDLVAAVGPGIGQCCYQVGADVVKAFDAKFANAREWIDGPYDALAAGESDPSWLPWLTMRPPGHPPSPPTAQLDLIAANRAILEESGVPASKISISGLCTASRMDLFFSHRREKTTGRMMAAIGIL